jgi:hypothetical protein
MGEKLKFEFEKLGKGRRHILTPQNITPWKFKILWFKKDSKHANVSNMMGRARHHVSYVGGNLTILANVSSVMHTFRTWSLKLWNYIDVKYLELNEA